MNVRFAAQSIRDSVDMQTILSLYGYQTDRSGFMCCPFHGERQGSMKIYPKNGGWHCYGCGRGGSVIDFVMEHENCDFRTAVIAIDKALNLRLMDAKENPIESGQQRKLQTWFDSFVAKVNEICDLMIAEIEAEQVENYKHVFKLEQLRDGNIERISAKDWCFILSFKENDEYNDYQKEKIRNFKEEVAAWRRKYRRAM